jgi:predicted negative regulator of RcsB-dependent stress response
VSETPNEGAAFHEECYACPIGSLFESAQKAQPEALEHLLSAAHELIQAARAALDVADQVVEQQRHARAAREPRLRRIDID